MSLSSPGDFSERYGPWALVAGASDGLGISVSHEIAARGVNVVMLARGEERLAAAADEVAHQHGVQTRTLALDLADPALGARAAEATADLEVGLLIYSAGMQFFGAFEQVPVEDHLRSIAVQCTGPVVLTHLLVPKMVRRGRGGIGIVSSTAAIQGTAGMAGYAAGKAFDWILAESLWAELTDQGIDMVTLLSGPIASDKFWIWQKTFNLDLCRHADSPDPIDRARARLLDPSDPRDVAITLLDGLGHGPVLHAHPLDEDISTLCLAAPRADAIALKRDIFVGLYATDAGSA